MAFPQALNKKPLTIGSALFEHREELKNRRSSRIKKTTIKLLITQELISKAMKSPYKRTPEDIDNLKREIEFMKSLDMRIVRMHHKENVASVRKTQQQRAKLYRERGEFHQQLLRDEQQPKRQITQQMIHQMVQQRQQIQWFLFEQQQELRQHQKQMKQQRHQARWLQSEMQQREIAQQQRQEPMKQQQFSHMLHQRKWQDNEDLMQQAVCNPSLDYALYEYREDMIKRRFTCMKKTLNKLLITQQLIAKGMKSPNKRTPEDVDNIKREIEFKKSLQMSIDRMQHEENVATVRKSQQQRAKLSQERGEFHQQLSLKQQLPQQQMTQQMIHRMVEQRQQIQWQRFEQQQEKRQQQQQMKQQQYQARWLETENQQREIAQQHRRKELESNGYVVTASSIKRRKYD